MTNIATLHNEVLDFLLEKRKENQELYFTFTNTILELYNDLPESEEEIHINNKIKQWRVV
jgi:recombinational DNA repair protein (RecF pathway)